MGDNLERVRAALTSDWQRAIDIAERLHRSPGEVYSDLCRLERQHLAEHGEVGKPPVWSWRAPQEANK